jgi:serine/threonine-protein kinase
LLAAVGWRSWAPRAAADRAVARFALELPANLSLADDYAAPFELSRDGVRLVLLARQDGVQQLFLREMGGLTPTALRGTLGAWQPTFSPDGRAVAFFAERKLRVSRLDTGEVSTLAEVGGNPRGVAWATDGTIVFAAPQRSPLLRVSDRGGTPAAVTRLDEAQGEAAHRWPQALPGGFVLFTVALEDRSYDEARLEVVALETGERKRVLENAAHGRVLPSGQLVFARNGRLHAVGFDPVRHEVRGTPEVVVDGVRYDPYNGATHFTLSDGGALVYSPGTPTSTERGLAFVSPEGELERLVDTPRALREPRLSPDGKRVAVVLGQARGSDLWLLDVASGTLSQLTFGLSPRRPTWTPDGRGITVGAPSASGWRILTVPAREGGAGDVILETANRAYPNAWSADGKTLVFQERSPGSAWDVFSADMGSSGRLEARRSLAATPAQEENAALSPDGRFLAYESDELDGIFEIYVRSLREGAPRVRVSTTGGRWPRFAPGGRLFYYYSFTPGGLRRIDYTVAADRFVAKDVVAVWARHAEGEAAVSRRVLVSSGDGPFDVNAQGSRFLMLERPEGAQEPLFKRPVVVLGFGDSLRASGPGAR